MICFDFQITPPPQKKKKNVVILIMTMWVLVIGIWLKDKPMKDSRGIIPPGASPGFSFKGGGGGGGGGCKRCACTNITSAKSFRVNGVQGPLIRALEALGVFDALSCYLSPLFQAFWYKMGLKKKIVDQILGRGACCAPSKSATDSKT